MKKNYKLLKGDCLQELKKLPDNSVDSVITDPPGGINFMSKAWDSDKGGRDHWIAWMTEVFTEVNRVLKPGGHGLVWSIPRTSHWTGMALEGAGFEIRDQISHLFGSGFPKSHNIGKAVDKKLGNDREVISKEKSPYTSPNSTSFNKSINNNIDENGYRIDIITKGTSEWEGFGTALKPSREDWWLIRKPLSEKTIVDNVLKWGVGGINIDGSRIGSDEELRRSSSGFYAKSDIFNNNEKYKINTLETNNNLGRFPSHTLHDGSDEVMDEFEKVGVSKSGSAEIKKTPNGGGWSQSSKIKNQFGFGDSGSVARFFYCSKPSTKERNMGMDGFEEKETKQFNKGMEGKKRSNGTTIKPPLKQMNTHPTIKSVKLMAYLINLITPPNSIVLDPFAGSGTTGISALLLEHKFIGIEMEDEYIEIAKVRLENYEKYRQFMK